MHPVVVVALAFALRDVPIPSLAKFLLAAPIAIVLLFTIAPWLRKAPLLGSVL